LSTARARQITAKLPASAHAPVVDGRRAHACDARLTRQAPPERGRPVERGSPLVVGVTRKPRIVSLAAIPVVLLDITGKCVETIMTTSGIPRIMTIIIQRDVRAAVIGIRRDRIIKSVPLVVEALRLLLMQGD
jgi:hypothetical protein